MPNPNDLGTNIERIQYAQTQLTAILKLVSIHQDGQVDVAGESIELSNDVKGRMKQKIVAAKVGCITALNGISIT